MACRRTCSRRTGRRAASTRSISARASSVPISTRWPFPIRAAGTFEVADLTLPKSVSETAVHSRQEFLKVVDQRYREVYKGAEHANMDGFTSQAWKMILNPAVHNAFDLSKEPEKLRDRYGRDAIGQSALLARRLVESGARFVTAAGFHSNSWDTHAKNDEGHKDRLCPPLGSDAVRSAR